mmetsp:Transcript_20601/g.61421  ORF Transcript_20601/g.61421 Transcript_20601/m.61421 type:complete len:203 (+) Transcript_20601:2383-2991(+)
MLRDHHGRKRDSGVQHPGHHVHLLGRLDAAARRLRLHCLLRVDHHVDHQHGLDRDAPEVPEGDSGREGGGLQGRSAHQRLYADAAENAAGGAQEPLAQQSAERVLRTGRPTGPRSRRRRERPQRHHRAGVAQVDPLPAHPSPRPLLPRGLAGLAVDAAGRLVDDGLRLQGRPALRRRRRGRRGEPVRGRGRRGREPAEYSIV